MNEEFVRCRFPEGNIEELTRKRYMEIIKRYLPDHHKVVDIGCGWGYGTWLLSKSYDKVVGVDFHMPHIEYCRKTYPDINFAYWDAQTMELKNWDLYIAMEIVECFEDVTHTIRQWIYELEGTLVVYTLDGRKPQPRAHANPYVKSLLTPDFVRSIAPDVKIWYTNAQYFWFEVVR